jgi:hypothetical protein
MPDFELISNLHPKNPIFYERDEILNLGFKVIGSKSPTTRPKSAMQSFKPRLRGESSQFLGSTGGTSLHDMASRISKEFGDGSQKFKNQLQIVSTQQSKNFERYKQSHDEYNPKTMIRETSGSKETLQDSAREYQLRELIQNQSMTILKKRDWMLSFNEPQPKSI